MRRHGVRPGNLLPELHLGSVGGHRIWPAWHAIQLHRGQGADGGLAGAVPYILGQVELPEGPQVLAEVVDVPVEDLDIGMELELVLRASAGEGAVSDKSDNMVYKWRPKMEVIS